MTKPSRLRWEGQVASREEMKCTYGFEIRVWCKEKLGWSRRRSKDDIKIEIKGIRGHNRCQALYVLLTVHLVTTLLTPWRRVLFEKLTGLQLVKKFPAFHGTRRFITALTSVRHLSLSWTSLIQSIYPHPTSWRSNLILSTHLCTGLPGGLFPSGFPMFRFPRYNPCK